MSSKKLTPCRTVGLSRKKSTGITLGILNETANINNTSQISPLLGKKSTLSQKPRKLDQNVITPCRRVGLSRKRKYTPLYPVDAGPIISTPKKDDIKESCITSNEVTIENSDVLNETVIPQLDDKEKVIKINEDRIVVTNSVTSKIEQSTGDLEKIKSKKVQAQKVPKGKVKTETKKKTKAAVTKNENKLENLNDAVSIEPKKLKYSTEQNTTKTHDPIKFLDKMRADENFNNTSNGGNQFIKVCYKDEQPSSDSEPLISYKTKNPVIKKKSVRKLDEDDDDDFQTTPLSLSRQTSRTDVLKSELKKKNTLKRTASSTSTNSDYIKNCSVKLEKIKDVTLKKSIIELSSDDDFDTAPPIPKEQVKTNIEYLEKQVGEKRKMLDDLKRAKSMKKIHDVEVLKDLTSRWRNGCKTALTDLLGELNKHASISMETLMTKFNISPDFFPSSQ